MTSSFPVDLVYVHYHHRPWYVSPAKSYLVFPIIQTWIIPKDEDLVFEPYSVYFLEEALDVYYRRKPRIVMIGPKELEPFFAALAESFARLGATSVFYPRLDYYELPTSLPYAARDREEPSLERLLARQFLRVDAAVCLLSPEVPISQVVRGELAFLRKLGCPLFEAIVPADPFLGFEETCADIAATVFPQMHVDGAIYGGHPLGTLPRSAFVDLDCTRSERREAYQRERAVVHSFRTVPRLLIQTLHIPVDKHLHIRRSRLGFETAVSNGPVEENYDWSPVPKALADLLKSAIGDISVVWKYLSSHPLAVSFHPSLWQWLRLHLKAAKLKLLDSRRK